MFVLGLTGGIGSGKTAASDFLATLGAAVIDADVIAHRLTEAGSPLLGVLQQAFGAWVLDAQGRYNRAAMRAYIFDKPAELDRLNAIMHPAIMHAISDELAVAVGEYAVLSVPLLFEGRHKSPSLLELCHHVLVIDVAVSTQLARAARRDGNDTTQIMNIINRQISRPDRLAFAHTIGADIVNNDGDVPSLHQQLAKLHDKYQQLAIKAQTSTTKTI